MNSSLRKATIVLTAVVLFGIIACTGVVSGFTADKVLPSGTTISPGDAVSISLGGLAASDTLNLSVSVTHLVNTTDSSYTIQYFSMPFGLQPGVVSAVGTNVNSMQLEVDDGTTDRIFTASGIPFTISQTKTINKQVYPLIKLSGTPSTNPPDVGMTFWTNGTVSPGPDSLPAYLNFTFQGATSGNVMISVYQGDTPVNSWPFTISVPSGQTASQTQQAPAFTPGISQTVTFSSQTATTLILNSSVAIPAGASITVTTYNAPPAGSTSPPSGLSSPGKYITIDAPDLVGKLDNVTIQIGYTSADIIGMDETTLRLYYFNPDTGAWEALPGGVDTTNKIIFGFKPHLSTYAAFASPTSSGGGGGGGQTGGGGGGGGGGGSSTGTFGRTAGIVQSGQLAPSAASEVTQVSGTGPLTSAPLVADLVGLPGVTVSWTAQINDNPAPNAQITTLIQQVPDQATLNAYTTALNLVGQDINNLAYVMIVQKTGLTSTGPATVSMSAPQDWVTQNGGNDAIRIVRMADDGTTEVLAATFDGYDRDSGYLVFKAASPNGLSTFGLVSVKAYTAPPTVQPTSATQQAPPQAEATTGGLPIMPIIAGIIIVLVVVGAGALYYSRAKTPPVQKKK